MKNSYLHKKSKTVSTLVSNHFRLITILLVSINLILGSLPILSGDIHFSSDIARDFLLYEEIDQKKIILIGPRASGLQGLFHGPLWLYINYPAYLIGNGNPLFVGYFWILLTLLFLVTSYYVAKKLFTSETASYYTVLLSSAMVFFIHGLFNPFGVMFILPLFFYTIYKYSETLKLPYLLAHVLILGTMIQFQMAIGIPFTLLSVLFTLVLLYRNKKLQHIFSYLLLIFPLSTFIVFDIRHNFSQLRSVLNSFTSDSTIAYTSFADRINNRWDNMIGNLYLVQGSYETVINGFISIILIFFLYGKFKQLQLKKVDRNSKIILLLLYFYIGFYVVSIFFNGILLTHYTFPLIPIIFLLFSSMYIYQKKLFIILFLSVITYNLYSGIDYINSLTNQIGKSQNSWQFQKQVAQKVFSAPEDNFGYAIYTPDYYGYSPKYAYSYVKKITPAKNTAFNQKEPITYLVVEPPPLNRPDIDPQFWIKEKLKITSKPSEVYTFENGFRIEKYELTQKELEIPPDPTVNEWIHFR